MKLRIAKAKVVIFCAVVLGACSVFAQGVFTVKSPAELQVVQRNQQDQASVVISGVIEGGADVIQAKADLNAAKAKGVTFLRMDKNRAVFKVESGSYKFVSKNY